MGPRSKIILSSLDAIVGELPAQPRSNKVVLRPE